MVGNYIVKNSETKQGRTEQLNAEKLLHARLNFEQAMNNQSNKNEQTNEVKERKTLQIYA